MNKIVQIFVDLIQLLKTWFTNGFKSELKT